MFRKGVCVYWLRGRCLGRRGQFPALDDLEAVQVEDYERGGVGESGVWRLGPEWDALSPPDAVLEDLIV
jgi:hypothetical protein